MTKTIWVLALILFSFPAWAQEFLPGCTSTCLDAGFDAGGAFAQSMAFENNIRSDYELLKKMEAYEGKGVDAVRMHVIRRMNGHLSTLGDMIKDIEEGRYLSSEVLAYIKAAGKKLAIGDADTSNFWKELQQTRDANNWKPNFTNEKLNQLVEQEIALALDTYIEYGNVFKIR